MTVHFIVVACSLKYKPDLPEYQIYIFDYSTNEEIRRNIKILKDRKIWEIISISVTVLTILVQIVLTIIKKNEDVSPNNQNNNADKKLQEQVVILQGHENDQKNGEQGLNDIPENLPSQEALKV